MLKNFSSAPLCILLALQTLTAQTTPTQVNGGGLTGSVSGLGYISNNMPAPPPGYGYGISFYENSWPLVQVPLDSFQIGLPSTWILPANAGYSGAGKLCPPNSVSAQNGFGNGNYTSFFQTIEGSMGFWGSTKFPSVTPKYRANSTPNCYTTEVSSQGWNFYGSPLPDSSMGIAQLSNRLLVAPDGLPLQPGLNNQLLGVAWMAMPFTGYTQGSTETYTMTSLFQAPKNRCLNSSSPDASLFAGAAYMASCDVSQPEIWLLQVAAPGYYTLQSQASQAANFCLEGNTGVSSAIHGGSPYMAPCNGSAGQLWALRSSNGAYQLQTQLSKKNNLCLESNDPDNGIAPRMNPCGAYSGQLWTFTQQIPAGQPPVGNKSWTLFLNSSNFRGPVEYFIPDGWEILAASTPASAGRGLDTLPGVAGGGAMEFNTVPMMFSKDSTGTVYTRIPRIQFPVDASGSTILMQDATFYSANSLFAGAAAWFAGGAAHTGPFSTSAAWTPTNCTVNPLDFGQYLTAADPNTRIALTGLDQTVQTKLFDSATCKWGLQWTGKQDMTASGMAVLPEYYQQNGNTRTVVPAAAVPASTGLTSATFRPASNNGPYTAGTPGSTAWAAPGPVLGPFSAVLSDGSILTYSWYRFIDQPVFQHLNLSDAAKADLQNIATKIHQSWPTNRDYMAPPSSGTLLALDAALLVTPPAGLEAGYVPVVTRQAKPTITSVTNAASGAAVIAPNTYITIKGTDLALADSNRIWQGDDFVNGKLPASLDGVSVTVNGKAAFVYYLSPTQINILTPPDAMTGAVAVQVTVKSAVSNAFNVGTQNVAPSFFTFGGAYVAATHADGSLLGPATLYPGSTTPAKPGEVIVLYGNGFGATSQAVVSGSPTQSGTLSPLPVVQIGGLTATVQFAGLISPGLY